MSIALGTRECVVIPIAELDALVAGTTEWFYFLWARFPELGLRFGLQDSSAMFLIGEASLVTTVRDGFEPRWTYLCSGCSLCEGR